MSDSLGSRQNSNTSAPSCCHSNKNDPAVATLILLFSLWSLFYCIYKSWRVFASGKSLAQGSFANVICWWSPMPVEDPFRRVTGSVWIFSGMLLFFGHMDKLSMARSHWLHPRTESGAYHSQHMILSPVTYSIVAIRHRERSALINTLFSPSSSATMSCLPFCCIK